MRRHLLILSALLLAACGNPVHEGLDADGNGGLDVPTGGEYSPADSREAFKTTLHPLVRQHCAGCHGVSQHPMFALADVQQAFNNISEAKVANLKSPATSYMVGKIKNGHNAFPQSLATEIQTQIAAWAKILADTATPIPGGPGEQPTTSGFSKISQEIFAPKCLSCHSGTNAQKGVRFDTYIATIKNVSAGAPNASKLYTQLTSGAMPPSGRLSETELNLIRDWIQAGALNN